MRHPDASLAAYVEGSATARERATAEAHLKTCAACRSEIKRAKLARTALAGLPEVASPGLDPAAIIQSVAAARAARAKRPAAAPAAALESIPTQEWAPQTPAAVEESAELEAGAEPQPAGAVQDIEVARRRRARDRSRALRVAEAALGAAAVLVAIVLFIGLRNQPTELRSAGGGSAESAQSPAQDAAAVTDYTPVTLTAHAKDLAAQINSSGRFTASEALAGGPAPASSDEGVSCIQRATGGLVKPGELYEIQQARFLGQPAWVGAFVTDTDTPSPTLLVIAVSIDRCTTDNVQQLIRERLEAPSSPASP
jgi:hypothetical protein